MITLWMATTVRVFQSVFLSFALILSLFWAFFLPRCVAMRWTALDYYWASQSIPPLSPERRESTTLDREIWEFLRWSQNHHKQAQMLKCLNALQRYRARYKLDHSEVATFRIINYLEYTNHNGIGLARHRPNGRNEIYPSSLIIVHLPNRLSNWR